MKIPKQAYTIEFKELAVKRIKDGQNVSRVCRELGLSDQVLRNWVKAAEGKLNGAGGRMVTPEEMKFSRLRAENLRLKQENEIQKKRRRNSQGCCVKYAWIAAQGKSFPLTEMRDVLNVSVSGYRAWKRGGTPDRKRLTDSQTLALICSIHAYATLGRRNFGGSSQCSTTVAEWC